MPIGVSKCDMTDNEVLQNRRRNWLKAMLQSLFNMGKIYKHSVYYPSQTRAFVETLVLTLFILCWPVSVPGFILRLIGASINAWLLYHWLFLDQLFSRIQYPAEEWMRTSLDALSQANSKTSEQQDFLEVNLKELPDHQHGEAQRNYSSAYKGMTHISHSVYLYARATGEIPNYAQIKPCKWF